MIYRTIALLTMIAMTIIAVYIMTILLDQNKPPKFSGYLVSNGKTLPNKTLTEHHNKDFQSDALTGKWTFLAYGYTHCPDICPTTLFTLAQLESKLKDSVEGNYSFIFYSIDPARDTPQILNAYMNYFSASFTGVVANNQLSAQTVESMLGIDKIIKIEGDNYQVSHSLSLLLFNPEGKLQAVFLPEVDETGWQAFKAKNLFRDFTLIRQFIVKEKLKTDLSLPSISTGS